MLVVIDMQKEWTNEQSPYYLKQMPDILTKVNTLIDLARKRHMPILFTQHIDDDFSDEGAQLLDELHIEAGDNIIQKHHISPFYKTNIDEFLPDEVMVCGALTNLCVRSFVEGAYDRDLQITIVTDCCATFDQQTHQFTLKDLQQTREEIEMLTLDQVQNT
jgi:nicotinamidase-related amidase